MRASWILDDRGDIWPEASRNLAMALNTRRSGQDLTQFLVGQMGFVAIRERGTWIEVGFNPDTVSPVALTGLYLQLRNRSFSAAAIIDPKNKDVPAIYRDRRALDRLINTLIETRSRRPDFELQSVELAQSAFATHWRNIFDICRADFKSTDKLALLDRMLSGHFIWAERAENGDFVPTHLTDAVKAYDPPSLASSEPPSFRCATDKSYGTWTADRFKALNGTDPPLAETVTAAVTFHRRPRQRYFYQRLIVPTVTSAGRDALLLSIADLRTVDLRQ